MALGDSLLFLGGLAIPWTVIGVAEIVKQARIGVQNIIPSTNAGPRMGANVDEPQDVPQETLTVSLEKTF